MALGKNWSEWWRRFLDLSTNESCTVVDILRERYVREMQQADRLKQYARRMHYPQYQGKLLQLATEENSWRSLSMALEDENRSADRLPEQLRRIGSSIRTSLNSY